jgi:hypothetical protein
MADLRDFTGKNRKFTGTIGERISTGTTAERDDATFGGGTIRFNTSTSLMEYYTGTEWKSIDAPPTIISFNIDAGANITSGFLGTDSSIKTIQINGSLFGAGAIVLFVGTGGGDVSPLTTVVNSSSLITVTVNSNSFSGSFEPYDIKVTNVSGLSAILENCIVSDTAPIFTTASGTLGSIFDSKRSSYSLSSAAATDPDGDTITYSISSGTLPTGLSFNSSTAAITGTASAVGTDTTSTFTVSAATSTQTATRSFSITVKAPVIDSFTSNGTFTVPVGVTSVDVLVVAGGGPSGTNHAGGGGAGGLIFRPGFTVTPGGSIPVTVGAQGPTSVPVKGNDSIFSTLTAKGGGGGKPGDFDGTNFPGGSASGGSHNPGSNRAGGTAIQPSQPGDSGTFGFGNPGGGGNYNGSPPQGAQGGGGGGAGAAGNTAGLNTPGQGGAGREYSISGSAVYYAGGGAGGGHQNDGSGSGGIGGGGSHGPGPNQVGQPGTANRGGGAGGSSDAGPSGNPTGGSGIVIVKY